MSFTVEIRLKRVDRIYRATGDKVEGVIFVSTTERGWDFKKILLKAIGSVQMLRHRIGDGPGKAALELLHEEINVSGQGKISEGQTEIPFAFPVRGIEGMPLHESYHGVYISIAYSIHLTIERGLLQSDITRDCEFIVETPGPPPEDMAPIPFAISRDALCVEDAVREKLPTFLVSGCLYSNSWAIGQPAMGELTVEHCAAPIRSVECQLVRIESLSSLDDKENKDTSSVGEPLLREVTEIQNMQIGDGDVCRGLTLPIYMVFPRLFSSPTNVCARFRLEFAVRLIISFKNGYSVTENFPIVLYRPGDGKIG